MFCQVFFFLSYMDKSKYFFSSPVTVYNSQVLAGIYLHREYTRQKIYIVCIGRYCQRVYKQRITRAAVIEAVKLKSVKQMKHCDKHLPKKGS